MESPTDATRSSGACSSHQTVCNLASAEIRRLELRIASESDTLTNLLRSLSRLDVSSGRAVGDSVCDFIGYGVGATRFALFLRVADKLVPCLGVEDGARVAVTAVAPIMPSLLRDIEGSVVLAFVLLLHELPWLHYHAFITNNTSL